ncbi:hypothetical protein BTS2_3532 [Bacillus sp. TS-2]|nr:hypothetical protein BTS2_3532 [Bacillus sp. TS-2]
MKRFMVNQGYIDLVQVEGAIKMAQQLIGDASIKMNENQIEAVNQAMLQAKVQYQKAWAYETGADSAHFHSSLN